MGVIFLFHLDVLPAPCAEGSRSSGHAPPVRWYTDSAGGVVVSVDPLRVFDPATSTSSINTPESRFKTELDTRSHRLNRN